MNQIVDTAFVVDFFADRASALGVEDRERVKRIGLAVACSTESFAMVTAALHQSGQPIPLAMVASGVVITPENSKYGEEYVLLDLAEVYVNETLFRVSCNGTLHEFTKTNPGRWSYRRTEAKTWFGHELEWIVDLMAPHHRSKLAQIAESGSVARRRTPQTTGA